LKTKRRRRDEQGKRAGREGAQRDNEEPKKDAAADYAETSVEAVQDLLGLHFDPWLGPGNSDGGFG
jgi:hypothetical protein